MQGTAAAQKHEAIQKIQGDPTHYSYTQCWLARQRRGPAPRSLPVIGGFRGARVSRQAHRLEPRRCPSTGLEGNSRPLPMVDDKKAKQTHTAGRQKDSPTAATPGGGS